MSTARFLIGDVFDRLAEIPDGSVDLVLTSPPFLALRSYLPADHPDKAKEIGSEATPAEFLDTLLALTAEWGRVLAPHGSIAIELGDTYAGSGGAGGDYNEEGLREGQPVFRARQNAAHDRSNHIGGNGWPLDKSLCGIPQAYQLSLAYGRNVLSGAESPAGMWRVRTLKPWIRSNPPVGALGDKERPATSYVVVATRARDRYFDLDAVRTTPQRDNNNNMNRHLPPTGGRHDDGHRFYSDGNAAGAPPRDWWHQVDAILDAELDHMAGKRQPSDRTQEGPQQYTPGGQPTRQTLRTEAPPGARGVHLRRALERAGILTTLEAVDVSPKGYSGAHYAVWPPELVRLLVDEMCPRRVCTTCGRPSRRVVESDRTDAHGRPLTKLFGSGSRPDPNRNRADPNTYEGQPSFRSHRTTVGWSTCSCPGTEATREDGYHNGTGWRPGLVLDPFVGSGTTLAVCTGMGRDAIGIDLDARNAELARERVGMFLEVDESEPELDPQRTFDDALQEAAPCT